LKKAYSFLFLFLSFIYSCSLTTDVFEKNVAIPRQEWSSSYKPEIDINIKDTTALYNIYIAIRHSDAYNFNNIWIRASVEQPGDAVKKSRQYDLPLASNEKGWFGTAMDDIYETRILIQPQTRFTKAGNYHFTLEQVMREDPLKHVLNVGIRIEKTIGNRQ
jgi:gliding motility-associated lipoprotein GldH